jgi:glycerol-3-phosphate dehydrogenase
VYEALNDRRELLETYPDLVKLHPFYIPVYRSGSRPVWMIWMGIKLYGMLAGSGDGNACGRVPISTFTQTFPALRRDDLKAVFVYYDGKTNDLALTERVADEARANGCIILEHSSVSKVRWLDSAFEVVSNGETFEAPVLINATGPWIDEVVTRLNLPARFNVRKVSGIHLFLDGVLVDEPLFMQTRERRIFFIIPEPENNQTLVGTTEREEHLPVDKVDVTEEDVIYLLNELNGYLKDTHQIDRKDVQAVSLGIRPLVAQKGDPTDLSREYELDLHRKGKTHLLNVFGGKLTTYLSLARKAAKILNVS